MFFSHLANEFDKLVYDAEPWGDKCDMGIIFLNFKFFFKKF
jgi:hypothetical protein